MAFGGRVYLVFSLFLVLVSGCTALVYQVVWQRYLAHHLGSHAFATTLILAVFFLCLSLGYLVIGRFSHRLVRNKLLLYGILEGLIGCYCLVSPHIFYALTELFAFRVGPGVGELGVELGFTALFIGFPTFLMGGTIPVLTDALSSRFEESHRTHALIYGANTVGAFTGTLLAGFLLIEILGLRVTLYATSAVNIALFLVTLAVSRIDPRSSRIVEPIETEMSVMPGEVRWLLLAQSFLSGFYVFSCENILIRMAGISMGSFTYTYSIIVASFILATAVGALAVGALRQIAGFRFFLAVQSALLASAVLLYLSIPSWPELFLRIRVLFDLALLNQKYYWAAMLLASSALLMVPVALMGTNLPLVFNYLRNRKQYLSQVVGQVYAVNSIGSALGALVGGYWLFNFFDGDEVLKISLLCILLTLPLLIWLFAREGRLQRRYALMPLLLIPLIWQLPPWEDERFVPGVFLYPKPRSDDASWNGYFERMRAQRREARILMSRYDPNTIVHVTEDPSGRAFHVNGKLDSHTAGDWISRTLTGLTPLSIAPKIGSVFIVGLGTGLSTSIVARFAEVEHVKVAEISEGVIEALPFFVDTNFDFEQNRHKHEIVRGDAYKVLLSSDEKYDLILSEPSSVWVGGVEKLFTRDFYEVAASRLADGGIYSQWFGTYNLDSEGFLEVLRSFRDAFPWVTIWSGQSYTVFLVGSHEAPEVDFERLQQRFEENRDIYESIDLGHPLAILGNQLLPPGAIDRLLEGHELAHTLDRPLLAYRAGRGFLAALRTNLDELVGNALARTVPSRPEAGAYLYDAYPGTLPMEFYEVSGGFRRKRSKEWRFIRNRMDLLRALSYPASGGNPLKPDEAELALLLLSDSADGEGAAQPLEEARFAPLSRVLQTLKLSQLSPKLDWVAQRVPETCPNVACIATKYQMIGFRHSRAELKAKGIEVTSPSELDDETRRRIEQIYAIEFSAPSA